MKQNIYKIKLFNLGFAGFVPMLRTAIRYFQACLKII